VSTGKRRRGNRELNRAVRFVRTDGSTLRRCHLTRHSLQAPFDGFCRPPFQCSPYNSAQVYCSALQAPQARVGVCSRTPPPCAGAVLVSPSSASTRVQS
jgi:hypothetical protein